MSKYLIYEQSTGKVWRYLDQYVIEDDGAILGGINGVNTLRYPPSVNPAILMITDDQFAEMSNKMSAYKVVDGALVEEAVAPSQFDLLEAQVTYTAMMTDTLLEEA